MLENISPMLIFVTLGVVIVICLVICVDPFGLSNKMKNTKEKFDGLTALNNKLFEKITHMATPNVADPNKYVPDIPQNSAQQLNDLIFPELKTMQSALPTEKPTEKPTESTPVESTPVESTPSFVLPDMHAPVEEPQPILFLSPTIPEQQIVQTTESKPFELPQTISTEPTLPTLPTLSPTLPTLSPTSPSFDPTVEPTLPTISDLLKNLDTPVETQSTFTLPSIISMDDGPITSYAPLLLEDQPTLIDVNASEMIKQLVATTSSTSTEVINNGVINGFSNSRIYGAFPLSGY